MTYKEEGMKVPKSARSPSVSNEAVKVATKLGLRKKCSHAALTTPLHEAPVEFILTPDGVVRKEDTGPDLEKKDVLMIDMCDLEHENQNMSLDVGLGITFTEEERKRVQRLVGLDQTILISFNDLEEEVAVKVVVAFCECKMRILSFRRFSMRCTRRLSRLRLWTTSWYFGDTPLP